MQRVDQVYHTPGSLLCILLLMKKEHAVLWTLLSDHSVKIKESEKRVKYLNATGKLRKVWNMRATVILVLVGWFVTVPKGLEKRLEELENRKNWGYSNSNFVDLGQNWKKSLGDLRRLAVIQTPVKQPPPKKKQTSKWYNDNRTTK